MRGFDCASPLTSQTARLFVLDGFTHCCRYLVPVGWKRLTKREVDDITAAGLKIVSVFETTANRSLGGGLNGSLDGQQALQSALTVGQTLGSVIYFAVDFDAQLEQMNTIFTYLQAAAAQIKGYEIGVYGSFAVVEAMKIFGIKHLWQTKAWSKGRISPSANIYQSDCGPNGKGLPMNGINVDLDIINDNAGGWNADMIPVVDANKIILNLQEYHALAASQAKKDEVHVNANYMRTISGQKTT